MGFHRSLCAGPDRGADIVQDFSRYRSQQQPAQGAAAMGRHHDQIRTLMLHHVVNGTSGLTLLQKRFHMQTWEGLGDKRLEALLFEPLHLVDRAGIRHRDLAVEGAKAIGMDHGKFAGEMLAHVTNVRSYSQAGVRIVDRKQDFSEWQHGPALSGTHCVQVECQSSTRRRRKVSRITASSPNRHKRRKPPQSKAR
jgi:hypothetical protein